MKSLLLLALLTAGSTALGALPRLPMITVTPITPTPPGKYTGVLTIRRALFQEGLETTFAVKVVAAIAADGQLTILSTTPESSGAAAEIENAIVRAVPRPVQVLAYPFIYPVLNIGGVTQPPPTGTLQTGGTTAVLGGLSYLTDPNYVVNGSIAANVTMSGRMVYLKYAIEQTQDLPVLSANAPSNSSTASTGATTVSIGSQSASFVLVPYRMPISRVSYEYALRLQRPLASPATPSSPR